MVANATRYPGRQRCTLELTRQSVGEMFVTLQHSSAASRSMDRGDQSPWRRRNSSPTGYTDQGGVAAGGERLQPTLVPLPEVDSSAAGMARSSGFPHDTCPNLHHTLSNPVSNSCSGLTVASQTPP